MTPCEEKGYKVNEVFEILDSEGCFEKDSIVVLTKVDRTTAPLFSLVKGKVLIGTATTDRCAHLSRVKRLYPPEETVTVTYDGKTAEISREQANAIGLI